MTPEQIAAVQSSFKAVAPIAGQAAQLFYGRLFEIAPEVKPLFKSDMTEQGAKLMATLGVVVNGLKDLPAIVPIAQRLALAHVGYGVKPEHYAHVGDALLWTLEKGLGEQFTPEVRDGWTAAYHTLSDVMISASYPRSSSGA